MMRIKREFSLILLASREARRNSNRFQQNKYLFIIRF